MAVEEQRGAGQLMAEDLESRCCDAELALRPNRLNQREQAVDDHRDAGRLTVGDLEARYCETELVKFRRHMAQNFESKEMGLSDDQQGAGRI